MYKGVVVCARWSWPLLPLTPGSFVQCSAQRLTVIIHPCVCSGRYYYWSVQTDQVCWLSPGHPKAVISMPADKLTGMLLLHKSVALLYSIELQPLYTQATPLSGVCVCV